MQKAGNGIGLQNALIAECIQYIMIEVKQTMMQGLNVSF